MARYPDPGGASGLAVRPCRGPLYGSAAVSERGLTGQILERLPADAALMADRTFAVFPVVWSAQQHNFDVLVRVTAERAQDRRPLLAPGRAGTPYRMAAQPA